MRGAVVVRVLPGKRRVEPIGRDQTDFDNSGSASTSVETLHITHATEFEMLLDEDTATTSSGGGSVALIGLADISGQIQQELRRHHSVRVSSTFTMERTSELQVPAHTHVRILLDWKRIWQDGVIELRTRNRDQVELPYSLTVGLDFDKTTLDVI